jgi:hypothetical protein
MAKGACGSRAPWAWVAIAAAVLVLPSCLVIVSTGPTTVSGANIIFVAVDDRGALVASLGVTVVAVDGHWREQGVTTHDGSFTCAISPGVSRVRASVTPPAGYVLSDSHAWPRDLDVAAGVSTRVEVRVRSSG